MDSNWRLEKLEIKFQQGYSHKEKEEEKIDRYEGRITFQNGEWESFSFKVKPNMAEEYIKLISKDVVENAERLGKDLVKSLMLNELE